jgi:bifunctional DNase/RNase
LELDGKDYVITIDDKSTPLSSESLTTTIEANPSDVSVVTLATEFGEPILISYANTNNKKSELSVESSADVFVMRSPRFYGVKINDMEELSKRIRAHLSYSELVSELSERIKNSPCPMDTSCSAIASLVAEEIAQDIKILDLIKE